MNIYSDIKKTTWRGAKVRKVIKFLESYQYIVGQPHFSMKDISDDFLDEKRKMEVSIYGTRLAIETVQSYMEKIFEIEEYSKKDFKKKIFSGAKVVSILEYIDFTIYNLQRNIELLQDEHNSFFSISENRDTFLIYWESQLETFLKVRKWVLFGLTQDKQEINQENDWIESVIYELDDE